MVTLTPKQAYTQYGISREKLLALEQDGTLANAITRTPGGHRRYDEDALKNVFTANEGSRAGRLDYSEFGSTGINRFGGSIYEERMKELRGRSGHILLREMRVNDPVISAIFFAIVNALRQADWRVKPASEKPKDIEVAEFVDTCLHDFSWSWHDQQTFVFDPMLEQGFSALEVVFKKRLGENPAPYIEDAATSLFNDGRVGWRKWAPRSAETLSPGNEWIWGPNGEIAGLNQYVQTDAPLGKNREISIPIEKMLLFRTTVHPNNNPEGLPIHRSMYLPWWYSNQLMEVEGIGVERNLTGIPVVYLGADCSMTGADSEYSMARELVTNLRIDEQMGVVLPKAKMGSGAAQGQGILLELLAPAAGTESAAKGVGAIIERYDKRKAVSVLAQFILLGMDRIGSFALSKNQSDLFVLAVKAFLLSVADTINRHAIPKLIRMNVFPGITGYPVLVPGTLGIPDLDGIANYVNKLVAKQVLTPDAELERHLRQIGGLPAMPINVSRGENGRVQQALTLSRVTKAFGYMQRINEIEEFPEKVPLRKQSPGHSGESSLRDGIAALWDEAETSIADIEEDDPDRELIIAGILALLAQEIEDLTRQIYTQIWLETAGRVDQDLVDAAVVRAMSFFDNFMTELGEELGSIPYDETEDLLANREHRALMYAGGAWVLYNVARTAGSDENEIWKWDGPIDRSSCDCCIEEVLLGARPLYSISTFPGGCQCLSRCRHELVKVGA